MRTTQSKPAATQPPRNAPVAERRPFSRTHHNVTVDDPYAWLEDENYPDVTDQDVLGYLNAENDYFERWVAPHQPLVDTLFAELKGRKPKADQGVPYETDGYRYQWRFENGLQYRTWYRQPIASSLTNEWDCFFDENGHAQGLDYFSLGSMSISPDGQRLAYSTDSSGAERYTLRVLDLTSAEELCAPVENTAGKAVWNSASDELLYLTVNDQWRPNRLFLKKLQQQSDNSSDALLYEEHDPAFFLGMGVSQSQALVLVASGDHVTSEVRLLPRFDFSANFTMVAPRETGHEYDVDHQGDAADLGRLLIRSNQRHANFDIFETPIATPTQQHWSLLVEGDEHTYITGHLSYREAFFVQQRIDGLDALSVHSNDQQHLIEFPEATYSLTMGTNPNYDDSYLRIGYTSLVTPNTVFDYHYQTRKLHTRKVQEIPGGYTADQFRSERVHAVARDNTQIPISLVHHKDTPLDGSAPLYLYGYGAYGLSIDPSFSTNRISLLERGFVFAIAHIRGGDDLGYHWYTQGKLEHRTNTFNDFVDCARHLVADGYTKTGRIAIGGGSAGGELMGAAINQAPELFGCVAAHVPFVDVLNTMLNKDLPLTPMEWPEWGNPIEDATAFDYIRSYSPYDQVSAQNYPPMLVTAGLNDPRVTYWEPAKWVAKLRATKTDDNVLLLKTNMEAGHGGKSGRFAALHELAEEYAFFLLMLGGEKPLD